MTKQLTRPTSQAGGPLFNEEVVSNGYLWFYIDALSDDGKYALTIIAFVGSVFSPFYAGARRHNLLNGVNPMQHCAINVALYAGVDGKPINAKSNRQSTHRQPVHQWAMTECNVASGKVDIGEAHFKVSDTTLVWDGRQLTIDIDELNIPFPAPSRVQAPFAKPLRGKVVVTPLALFAQSYALDALDRHHWRPIAPLARVEVQMSSPGITWQGAAYWDSNYGREPLEAAFIGWDWSRTKPTTNDASTIIVYDLMRADGTNFTLAKRFSVNATGSNVQEFAAPPKAALRRSAWGVSRRTVCDAGTNAKVITTVEDTPFYARSVVSTNIHGVPTTMFHESLSLKRFSTRWVQALLPFKMRRG